MLDLRAQPFCYMYIFFKNLDVTENQFLNPSQVIFAKDAIQVVFFCMFFFLPVTASYDYTPLIQAFLHAPKSYYDLTRCLFIVKLGQRLHRFRVGVWQATRAHVTEACLFSGSPRLRPAPPALPARCPDSWGPGSRGPIRSTSSRSCGGSRSTPPCQARLSCWKCLP